MKKYIVIQEFADKNDISKRYVPGDELPGTFDKERLANIVNLGLAKVKGEQSDEPEEPTESEAPKTPKATKRPKEPVKD